MPTDPFLDDGNDDNGNNGIRELREHISKLEGDLKEASKARQKAEARLAESETKHRVTAARGFGLSENQAQAFLSLNPEADVTEEAVKGFASNLGITLAGSEPTTPAPEAAAEPAEPSPEPFRPAAGNEPPTSKMPYAEAKKLLHSVDPADRERFEALAMAGGIEGIDPD